MTLAPDCGATTDAPFAFYDPDSRSLRTSQGSFPLDSTPCSLTLPKSGSMRSGRLYARPMSGSATAGSASSFLPTPAAQESGQSPDYHAEMKRLKMGGTPRHTVTSLSVMARQSSVVKLNGRTPADPQVGLADQVAALLPTPTSQAAKHGETPDVTAHGFGYNLWDLPGLLGTPRSSTAKGANSTEVRAGTLKARLENQVAWRFGEDSSRPSGAGSTSSAEQLLLLPTSGDD